MVFISSNSRHLSNGCREDAGQWLNRPLSSHYSAVDINANIATRRDRQVSKETCHAILGVLEDGSREVLSVDNHPGEGPYDGRKSLRR
ncbi:transposase [Prevotella nigrescens]|uniref:transposase n=1 Tax=Prevotella nigrescens TaxID=28133 RepID=UPI003119A3E6